MTDSNNLTDSLTESRLFIQHLENYKVPKRIIKIAEKIDFTGILILFKNNYEVLWEEIVKSRKDKNINYIKKELKDKILLLLRPSIFNVLHLGIKDLEPKKVNIDELNEGILRDFEKIMQNLLSAFELQYQLTLIQTKISKKAVDKVEEKQDKVEKTEEEKVKEYTPIKKTTDKSFKPEDIPYYEKVLEALEEIKKKGEHSSMRQAALRVAKEDMGLTQKNEIQDFYNRFVTYNIKKKKNRIHKS